MILISEEKDLTEIITWRRNNTYFLLPGGPELEPFTPYGTRLVLRV